MTKHLVKGLALSALALALTAAPAAAQIAWSVGAGFSSPNGDLSDAVKTGFHGLVAGDLKLTGSPISIRADGMYTTFSSKASGGSSSNVISVGVDAKYGFAPGPVSPYIVGGPTWGRFSCDGCTAESRLGFNVGAGVNFGLSALKLFAEARYISTSKDGNKANWIPITLGIHF